VSRYILPDLPYDYGALEPHISGRIMELHHDKHHRKYVDTANETIEKLLASRQKSDFAARSKMSDKIFVSVRAKKHDACEEHDYADANQPIGAKP